MKVSLLAITALFFSCATGDLHPCVRGGDPSHEKVSLSGVPNGEVKIGTRQCVQRKLPGGAYLNDGRYREWHPNGKLLVEGEYKMGKKHGKWREWDLDGKPGSEHWYEDGKEVPNREAPIPPTNTAPRNP